MKPLWIICALFAILSASPLCAQVTVRVLTYNIHRDIGASDSNVSSQPALAKIVNYLKPDVWTLQELGGNNVHYSAAVAHGNLAGFIQQNLTIFGPNPQENVDFFIYVSSISDGYDTVAIVSRYPFAYTHTYADAGNGFGSLRGFPLASISVPGPTKLDVFTAHLKALSTTTDAEKRQTEADVDHNNVFNWISAHRADAIVTTGDWNESEDAGDKTNWSGHNIGDMLPTPNEPYHPITTMLSAGLLDPRPLSIRGAPDTINAATPNTRFDYNTFAKAAYLRGEVFDTKQHSAAELAALNAANGTNFIASDSADASDHLPVLTVVRVGFTPVVIATQTDGATLALTYERIVAANVSYTVEQSNDLLSWTTASPTQQVLAQNLGSETLRASVPTSGRSSVFLRVPAAVAP
ncbi:MAG TPA: endonuclease/exonuclease/phosphatase family protein [Chthoniobacterales bacterium]|jgi:endonuclease/exonuclease/phosphatase family metal-dependent hydrolase